MARLPVLLAPLARTDLSTLLDDLDHTAGPSIAEKYVFRFERLILELGAFPEAGFPRPRLGKGIRMRVVAPYVVLYAVREDTVTVTRVLHGARKITRSMIQE
ncbi:MAG: type II toxin-antitoxin system RelE/ParE family toxin [Hyphomicrobiaceae bacterium]